MVDITFAVAKITLSMVKTTYAVVNSKFVGVKVIFYFIGQNRSWLTKIMFALVAHWLLVYWPTSFFRAKIEVAVKIQQRIGYDRQIVSETIRTNLPQTTVHT